MIKLIYKADPEIAEFGVDEVIIEKEETGSIEEYVLAFGTFLRAVGFVDGTIKEALPTYE